MMGKPCPSKFKRSSHPPGFVQTSHTAHMRVTPSGLVIVKPTGSRIDA